MNKLIDFNSIKQLKNILGIDFHVLNTLIFRSWGIIAGGVTITLIPFGFTPVTQGYYYAFASILALQIFFELGLNQVIIQLVSHDAAHIQVKGNGLLEGEIERVNRLNGLVALIRRWYTFAAIMFALVAGASGWIFFVNRSQVLPADQWLPAWLLLVGLTSINLYLSPRLAIVEGIGLIGETARMRLLQSLLGNMVFWLLLISGAQLWATAAIPATSVIITSTWLKINAGWIKNSRANSSIKWRRDVFPLQWRISLSWMSGYILFHLFTPLVFSTHGPVEAGRLGLAIAIFGAINSLGMSWIVAKTPQFTMHISRGESKELNRLFKSSAVQATVFTGLLAFIVYLGALFVNSINLSISNRLAVPEILLWMAIGSIINTFIFAAATYMRAHREEPMLLPSIVGALLTILTIYITKEDITTMMKTVTLMNALVGLPWALILLKRYWCRHVIN